MNIELIRATVEDARQLWEMQVKSFQKLLEKYQDYETNPANESIDKVIGRLNQKETYYYFVCLDKIKVGAIRVIDDKTEKTKESVRYSLCRNIKIEGLHKLQWRCVNKIMVLKIGN